MDEAKAEIYKYIRDQHDKHVAHRESLTSRFGNVRLTAGLILTVFSFSLGLVAKTLENAHGITPRVVAMLPLLFFAIALYFVTRSLLTIPDLVGTVHVYFPSTDRTAINKAFAANELDSDQVIEDLSQNYLDAIDKNSSAKQHAGEQLRRCVASIRLALLATVAFLVTTLVSSILTGWLFRT